MWCSDEVKFRDYPFFPFVRPTSLKMRLSRQQSMTRAYEFARVRKEGSSTAGRFIVLSARPLENPEEESRFGIICTKKTASKAVTRNLLKRRIREIIRNHGDIFQQGYHLVIVLRWRSVECEYSDLERDFIKNSKRLIRAIKATPDHDE